MERYPVLVVYLQCAPKIGYRPILCLQHGATPHEQCRSAVFEKLWDTLRDLSGGKAAGRFWRGGFGGAFCIGLKYQAAFAASSALVWKR